MKDLEIIMDHTIGALATIGEILGRNGISLEGGGLFTNGAHSIAHFLVKDAEKAKILLSGAGITDVKINRVIIQKLRQDVPGQLGMFCRQLVNAGVTILTQYSDHANQLIIVPDDYETAKIVSAEWMKEWWS